MNSPHAAVVFGYRLTRRPVTVVKFHNCDISMLCKAYQSHGGGWGGVGWGGIITSLLLRSHALACIRHATLLCILKHLHTFVMLRCRTVFSTCTHTSCYSAVRWGGWGGIMTSLALRSHSLPHIRHGTLPHVLMHLQSYIMPRCCAFSSTCAHTSS